MLLDLATMGWYSLTFKAAEGGGPERAGLVTIWVERFPHPS